MNVGEKRSFVCIRCPIGCALTAEMTDGGITVSGNTCKRGAEYAVAECTAPTRIVTSTVRLKGGTLPCVPVKAGPVPKDKMFDVIAAIKSAELTAPVSIGDIAVSDVAGTGADVVVTRSVPAAAEDKR